MTTIVTLFATVVLMPVFVGWIYGRNHVDPESAEGEIYYKRVFVGEED